ncbi:MAG: FKBP-type peptidyl-prolyl cis-trans isomerase [Candidatus Peribacteria bacterium]|jgi:FKBP-type peptidyl-prolyl cis-trans isomerase 2|nr:FKBP-type peptidyl-prolyl cis-trans isomerase [Candidatus Peribacteria bacterium]
MKKKTLTLGILSLTFILSACGTEKPQNTEEITNNLPQENLLSNNENTQMTCKEAIQQYLQNADTQGHGAEIKAGDQITVDYIGRLDDETVFDTSIESIAKACGKYNEARNYQEGLTFYVGVEPREMIEGFEAGVMGMKVGQTKTVTFGPEQGYGQPRAELIMSFPLSDLPNADDFQEGMVIYLDYGTPATITKKTDKEITLDMNHELAGKDLTFDITIKSIN